MTAALTGGGARGQVRFTAAGSPGFAFICRCRSCQHMPGSGDAVQVCHDPDAFRGTGNTVGWTRGTGHGATVTRVFCPACGCPAYGTAPRAESLAMLAAGAFGNPSVPAPDRVLIADEAQLRDHALVPSTA